MTETAIRIENLARDFVPVRALDSLSLEVPVDIIFGFLGPNGGGKTTDTSRPRGGRLMRLLGGTVQHLYPAA